MDGHTFDPKAAVFTTEYRVYVSGAGSYPELLEAFDTVEDAQECVAREVGAPGCWREDFPADPKDGWRFGGMDYPEPDPRYLYIERGVGHRGGRG